MKTEDVLGLDITDMMQQVVTPEKIEPVVPKEDTTEIKEKKDDVLELNVNNIFESASKEVSESSIIKTDTGKKEDITEGKGESPAPKDSKSSGEDFTLVFARYLKEQGTLTDLNEEELTSTLKEKGQVGAMEYMIQKEIDTNKELIKSAYDDANKRFFELIEAGVDEAQAAGFIKSSVSLSQITDAQIEADENLRKGLLTELYRMTMPGADVKRITKMVTNHISLGEDTEEAKSAKQELLKLIAEREAGAVQAAKDEATQVELQRTESLKKLNETIEAIDEIIPGQKINKQTKQKITEMMTKAVKEVNGRPMNGIWAKRAENPLKFDAVLAYLIQTGAFDGKGLDKVMKVATTKITKELEDKLRTQTPSSFLGGKTVMDLSNYGAATDISRKMIEDMKNSNA